VISTASELQQNSFEHLSDDTDGFVHEKSKRTIDLWCTAPSEGRDKALLA
jgi:hypothetical protein